MKILMIMPNARMHTVGFGPFKRSLREAPLTLTTLAALTPRQFECRLVDCSIDDIPWDYPADLVAISVLTGTAMRAYEIADKFRAMGKPVVLGGVHVTLLPEEALPHSDAIVVGPAESAWPQLICDFSNGEMKVRYEDWTFQKDGDLLNVPTPRNELQRRSGYVIPDTVQATRGCRHRCDFCAVSGAWPHYVKRPIGDVIRDVGKLPGKRIAFNDVSLVDDVEYAKELFKALAPLKKKWGGLATALVADDEELLDLAQKSGCIYLLIGFESLSGSTLSYIGKRFNRPIDYKRVMKELHKRGISVQGCFVFGFDEDTTDIFEKVVDTVQELQVDIPRYSIYTPYPGTPLFQRLKDEKRILTYNWDNYDTMHVVFQPKNMTPEELYKGFKHAYRETFKMGHIIGRTLVGNQLSLINFVGNLVYKKFLHRLKHEERFKQPYAENYRKELQT